MARQLLLMRHASLGAEYSGRFIGRTDASIAPDSHRGIHTAGKWLSRQSIEQCIASPLLRTRQTLELINSQLGCQVDFDPDLREVDFGRWEGKTFSEISQADPQLVEQWASLADDFVFPGGESWAGFVERIARVSGRLAVNPAENILVITHGGVIRSLICHLLGLAARNYLLFDVRCGGCCVIDLFEGKGVLRGLNEPVEVN